MISVIIPVYKVEKYLDECIMSVVSQTYKDIEVIIVDDGSPDSCPQICDNWAKKDSRIRVIHQENAGLSVAIASDYNPGSSPCGDMRFIMALACIYMRLLPEEAFNAVINHVDICVEV